ncbi:unnamed protein product [Clonostachys rhizophaga]|uniref:Uncharacterized protein n=1 Tax=Clonostachys rhizophaga TaxID=160324 RepID=A0A9N9VIQ6_9HYPO|nr:unnamed protein product [Clonostachys rhizophaga]
MPPSHRRLVHRHAERLLTGKGRELAPGESRIFSYYAPSLDGGLHNVSISQTISVPAEAGNAKEAPRRPVKLGAPSPSSIVVTPRFSLAPGVIDLVYPTPGISVEHTILPHIVFTDPHLPWSRSPSPAHTPEDEDKGNPRSSSTWLALLVFSLDELQLNQSQVKHIFQNMPPDIKLEQSETCTLRTLAGHAPLPNDIENLVNTTGFKEHEDALDAAEPTELIMVPGKLFNGLFVAPDGPRDKLDVACYKHMAHVRQVATDGMVNAGADSDEAISSVVVSRRTGPFDADTPSTMIAHLVSLSWDDEMLLPKDEDHVAMVSLHSWTYTYLPSKNKAKTPDMLANLVTGEVTAALLRGPLTPVQVPRPLTNNTLMLSNFGTDLDILDPRLGLMDITYSSAWQLGKSLAMADVAFCAALARHRDAVQGGGLNAAKRDVRALFDGDRYGTRQRAAGRMVDLVRGLNQMNTSLDTRGGDATAARTNRWSYDDAHEDEPGARTQPVDMLSQSTPHIASRLPAQSDEVALRLAMAVQLDTKDEGEDVGEVIYNEHNTPASPDYALIYSWVLDKVHLGDIPAQYLIPDPAFLPEETLCFFHVDANWVDALIDGALSLANHWGDKPEKDLSRASIKKAINKRLRTANKSLGGWHVQMPRYGFLLRSQLVVEFPDLTVDVKLSDTRSHTSQKRDGFRHLRYPYFSGFDPQNAALLPQSFNPLPHPVSASALLDWVRLAEKRVQREGTLMSASRSQQELPE